MFIINLLNKYKYNSYSIFFLRNTRKIYKRNVYIKPIIIFYYSILLVCNIREKHYYCRDKRNHYETSRFLFFYFIYFNYY